MQRVEEIRQRRERVFTKRRLAGKLARDRQREADRKVVAEGEHLIRKELLAIDTDPFSPERGQLGFLQALVQRVTYETIARRDRRARHLAVARFLGTDADVNIATDHEEFRAWRWSDPADLPRLIVPFKKALYEQVLAAFAPHLGASGPR